MNNESGPSTKEEWEAAYFKMMEMRDSLKAELAQLRCELHAKAVCDCHSWPSIKEFHEYTEAIEKERDRLAKELVLEKHKPSKVKP